MNFVLSMFACRLVWLVEPFLWRSIRCTTISTIPIRGVTKCKEKNRFNVGCETENPPHIHITLLLPMYGMAEKMFVITVAPQKDICPQGRTYPRNAEAMNTTKIVRPLIHVWCFFFVDLFQIPRSMWVKMSRNSRVAVFT